MKRPIIEKQQDEVYNLGTMPHAKISHMQSRIIASKQLKGRKKGKLLCPMIEDVLIGKKTNAMADMEELRNKREEDALQCDCILKKIGNVVTAEPHGKGIFNALEDNSVKRNSTVEDNLQYQSLSPKFIPISTSEDPNLRISLLMFTI